MCKCYKMSEQSVLFLLLLMAAAICNAVQLSIYRQYQMSLRVFSTDFLFIYLYDFPPTIISFNSLHLSKMQNSCLLNYVFEKTLANHLTT